MEADKELHFRDMDASSVTNPEKWSVQNSDPTFDRGLIVLLYGSWNHRTSKSIGDLTTLASSIKGENPNVKNFCTASIKVDNDDESYDLCINGVIAAPSELPAIVFVGAPSTDDCDRLVARYGNNYDVTKILRVEYASFSGRKLETLLSLDNAKDERNTKRLKADMKATLSRMFDSEGKLRPPSPKPRVFQDTIRINSEPATRIFIAGDRSQVGKSSICMGILGALLNSGKYSPSDLAYIKPATQCEKTQLVEEFCKSKGITSCVPIGPIVYYKGFTRAFLKGEVGETSEQLLCKTSRAVDDLAVGKKVVIIDGVGYPAVGSITGTDNASVALWCGSYLGHSLTRIPAPVLLIGKSGVGDAIDSFNINATYFDHRGIPVIGAIFNKLSLQGFYSLENCKEAIEMYFRKFQPDKRVFGFIPEILSLTDARESPTNSSKTERLKQALEAADLFVDQFAQHINVENIISAAKEATELYKQSGISSFGEDVCKRKLVESRDELHHKKQRRSIDKNSNLTSMSLTRSQIEAMASAAGAVGG